MKVEAIFRQKSPLDQKRRKKGFKRQIQKKGNEKAKRKKKGKACLKRQVGSSAHRVDQVADGVEVLSLDDLADQLAVTAVFVSLREVDAVAGLQRAEVRRRERHFHGALPAADQVDEHARADEILRFLHRHFQSEQRTATRRPGAISSVQKERMGDHLEQIMERKLHQDKARRRNRLSPIFGQPKYCNKRFDFAQITQYECYRFETLPTLQSQFDQKKLEDLQKSTYF